MEAPAPFVVGLNHPWQGYGWDFGPTPYGPGRIRTERDAITRALERARGNVAEAARELRLQPTYLHRLLTNLGLRTGH